VITHVVSFRWKPEITDADLAAIAAALDALPAAVPSIRSYRHGRDLGVGAAANHDYAIVATFDDIAGYHEYDVHPQHDAARSEVIRPWIAERAAVQFGS